MALRWYCTTVRAESAAAAAAYVYYRYLYIYTRYTCPPNLGRLKCVQTSPSSMTNSLVAGVGQYEHGRSRIGIKHVSAPRRTRPTIEIDE